MLRPEYQHDYLASLSAPNLVKAAIEGRLPQTSRARECPLSG
jgi:hypothetical protein